MLNYKSIKEKWNSKADAENSWDNLDEDEKIEFTIKTVMGMSEEKTVLRFPEMIPVVSSNIASVGYDEDNWIVYVQFLNSSMYAYKNVPEDEYQNLLNASSIGSYFNRNFKHAFQFEKI